jgi:hypothetical protein
LAKKLQSARDANEAKLKQATEKSRQAQFKSSMQHAALASVRACIEARLKELEGIVLGTTTTVCKWDLSGFDVTVANHHKWKMIVSANSRCYLATLMSNMGSASSRVTKPSHGTAAWEDTGLTYKPDPDYRGEDHFQVWVTWGQKFEFDAVVTVIVE